MSSNRDRHGQPHYGQLHKQIRRRWAPRVGAGKVDCWRCGRLIAPGVKWDLGHVSEEGRGRGYPARHPEHRHSRDCPAGGNRATLTHLKQKLEQTSTPSREW